MESGKAIKGEARQRDWKFWAAIVWAGLFILWMYYISRCLPGYDVAPNQTVHYSQLMFVNGRPAWLVYSPLFVFGVFNIGTIGLAVLSEQRWLLLTLWANPFVCLILATSVFCSDFTQLSHLESVEFDGHTYHLVEATTGDWDMAYDFLQLYECDLGGELCRGQSIYVSGDFIKPGDASMMVDAQTRQLKLSYLNSIIFTRDEMNISALSALDNVGSITTRNVARLEELARLNYGRMDVLDWSPDGERLAAGGNAGVWLHEFNQDTVQTYRLIMPGSADDINSLKFSPDGQTFAAADWFSGVDLWDVRTKSMIESLPAAEVRDIAFNPIHRILAVSSDESLKFYNLDTFTDEIFLEDGLWFDKLMFSPDGKHLAAGGYDSKNGTGYVGIWEVDSRENLFLAHNDRFNYAPIAFSSDSRLFGYVIRTSIGLFEYESNLHLWDTHTQSEVMAFELPNSAFVSVLTFSPDGKLLVTAGSPSSTSASALLIWEVETGALLHSRETEADIVALAFRPDGKLIALADSAGGVQLWGVEN